MTTARSSGLFHRVSQSKLILELKVILKFNGLQGLMTFMVIDMLDEQKKTFLMDFIVLLASTLTMQSALFSRTG